MSTYYVPAIWRGGDDRISHVVAKALDEKTDTLARGVKLTVSQVIQMIGAGHEFYTAKYSYSKAWSRRAKIHVVKEGNIQYIRSNHDKTETDNLENMIPMYWLGF